MRIARTLSALALGFVFATAIAPAFAQEGEPVAHSHRHRAPGAGGADEPGEAEGEETAIDQDSIVNWWSFDYGANAKNPAHHDWPPPFGWALVNFAVFLGVMAKILWRPLKRGWAERHDSIRHELDEATRLRKEAEAQLATYRHKVANVDGEVATLLTQLRADADADRVRLIAAAEAEAKRIKTESDRQIQIEIERARVELRRETVTAALKAAQMLLRENVREEDQARLAERYAADLDQVAQKATGGAS